MTDATSAARWRTGILAAVLIAGGGGYWIGQRGQGEAPTGATSNARKILYYYDPMFPNQKFDKPGKSPFMDMQLEPKYADEGGGATAPGISVDPAARQSLGIRVVAAEMGSLAATFDVNGTVDFNQRDVAIVQARSGGFVERVYRLAPGDVIRAGAPIADLQLPEWGSAQTEYLSVKRLGRPDLTAAARQRLRLMGMPEAVIAQVDRSGRTSGTVTVRAPIGGVVQTLGARAGVTLAEGQTLAEISGLGTVWLNAALPEAQSGAVQVGQRATAKLTAFPGEAFGGRVVAILPTAAADSRTLTVRVELANRGGRLRPCDARGNWASPWTKCARCSDSQMAARAAVPTSATSRRRICAGASPCAATTCAFSTPGRPCNSPDSRSIQRSASSGTSGSRSSISSLTVSVIVQSSIFQPFAGPFLIIPRLPATALAFDSMAIGFT